MSENKGYDLYNNPMVTSAINSLSPEEIEQYKRIGEYMYNSIDYKEVGMVSNVKPQNTKDTLLYAEISLKSGLSPFDLSKDELTSLIEKYGEKWYERFEYTMDEVPPNPVSLAPPTITRQQLRAIERKMKKLEKSKRS